MYSTVLKRTLLVLIALSLLVLLTLPAQAHMAYGLAEKETPQMKGTPKITLGETYKDTFNVSHREKLYILEIAEPGVYLINASATLYGYYYFSGELEIKTWGEEYLPWLDENVTTKQTLADMWWSPYYNGTTWEYKTVFVDTGEVYILWDWSIDDPSQRAETTLTVRKLAALTEATTFTGEFSHNFTKGYVVKLLKFTVTDEGFYNVTLSSICGVNTSAYIKYLEFKIYIEDLTANEKLTIYLNGHEIGVVSNWSGGYWSTRIPLEYANLTGENNLTLVYKGPDSAYVGSASLILHYWDWYSWLGAWRESWQELCYWSIYESISGTWNKTEYVYYPAYTEISYPVVVRIFDSTHGLKMASYTLGEESIWIELTGEVKKISRNTTMPWIYLKPGTYYLWVDIGRLIGYAYVEVSVEKLDIATIDTEGALTLTFNVTNNQKYVALRLPPDKYYNVSLSIVSGGNWTIRAYTPTGTVALEHGIWGTKDSMNERQQSLQNLAVAMIMIPWYYWYYYWYYSERDIAGAVHPIQMYSMQGENVTYVNGKLAGLGTYYFYYYSEVVPIMILSVSASPVTGYTPSSSVNVSLSVKVTGTVETLLPGERKIADFNSTTGPTFKVYKVNLTIGSVYCVNGTPLEYEKNGSIAVGMVPVTIKDWYYWYGYYYYYHGEGVNRSVYCTVFPTTPNATYYIFLEAKDGDTTKASIEITKYEPKDYNFGEKIALSLVSPNIDPSILEKCIYRFEVKENYTYVVTVKTGANFTGATILLVDTYGNTPFKYEYLNPPTLEVSDQYKDITWEFIAKENTTVTMLVTGSSGALNITVTEVKSYETGYSEGYNTGYKSGYESGTSSGQMTGLAIGAPVGLVIGAAIVYLIMRRRIAA